MQSDYFQALEGMCAQPGAAFDEILFFDDVEGGHCGGGANGTLFVGVVAHGRVARDVEVGPGEHRGHGKHPAAESLAQTEHVRDDVEVFVGEEVSRAPEAQGDFVENQERAVAVTNFADPGPVLFWGQYYVGAAQRLCDEGGHIAFVFHYVFDVVGARDGIAAQFGVARRRDVAGAGHQRSQAFSEEGFAAHADGVHGGPVETIPPTDGFEAAGRQPG